MRSWCRIGCRSRACNVTRCGSTDSRADGHAIGWMTQGIRDPQDYYYRHAYADAVRALELLANRDEVDEKRLAVTGFSQGGGMALAVAALSERPILAMA